MPKIGRPRRGSVDKWESIKSEVCSGRYSMNEVGRRWDISAGTIKSRAHREDWPTPTKLNAKKEEFRQLATEAVVQGLMGSGFDPGSLEAKGFAEGLSESTLDLTGNERKGMESGEYLAIMAKFAMGLASEGIKTVARPRNLREIALADTLARRALGLDAKGGGGGATMIRVTSGPGCTVDVASIQGSGVEGSDEYFDDDDDD